MPFLTVDENDSYMSLHDTADELLEYLDDYDLEIYNIEVYHCVSLGIQHPIKTP